MTETEGQVPGSSSTEPASPDGRPSRLRDAASLTKWVKVLLCCWMAAKLVAFASDWALLRFFQDIEQGLYSSRSAAMRDAVMLDQIDRLIGIGGGALFLLTAILFLRWVHRANENARRLGAVDMEYTPGWAVGCYFLPVLYLVMPYQAMREIWNASSSPTAWQSLRGHWIVRLWWGLFLGWNLVGYAALIARYSAKGSVSASILSAQIHLIFDASAIAAGIGALLLVTRLRAIQMARGSAAAP